MTGVLSRDELLALLASEPPIVAGLADPDTQIQPNGIDLTVAALGRFSTAGTLPVDNTGRQLAETTPVEVGWDGRWRLEQGPYLVRFAEIVNVPVDCMAYARPRSSLLRCGVAIHTAVWDAGYSGQGVALLVVYNPAGFTLEPGARIVQLVFHRLSQPTEGYRGIYQGERSDR